MHAGNDVKLGQLKVAKFFDHQALRYNTGHPSAALLGPRLRELPSARSYRRHKSVRYRLPPTGCPARGPLLESIAVAHAGATKNTNTLQRALWNSFAYGAHARLLPSLIRCSSEDMRLRQKSIDFALTVRVRRAENFLRRNAC